MNAVLKYSILGLVGASIGSFIATFSDRWPRGKSLLSRSRCSACHERIRFSDLVPIFSYIALSGRCRACGAWIPLQLFVVEALALGITARVFGGIGISWSSLVLALALLSLLAMSELYAISKENLILNEHRLDSRAWYGYDRRNSAGRLIGLYGPVMSRAISFPRVGHKYSPPVALFERLVYGVLERLSSSDGIKGVVVS